MPRAPGPILRAAGSPLTPERPQTDVSRTSASSRPRSATSFKWSCLSHRRTGRCRYRSTSRRGTCRAA